MDSKTLATIIAVAKKESRGYLSDFSKLEAKIEGQLKALHKEEPIVETPGFIMHNGCLYCTWASGRSTNLGNVRGSDGEDGTNGVDGIDGLPGLNGTDGSYGVPGDVGKNGVDGDKGKAGTQGLRGAKGPVGLQGDKGIPGLPGVDGTDGRKGLDGLDGDDGVGLQKAWVDDKYHLTLRLDSGKVLDAGYVRGPAGISGAGKGGRVTGGYTGGGSGSNFYVTGATYNEAGELVITNSNGSNINAGKAARTGIAELDFGLSSKTATVNVPFNVLGTDIIFCSMYIDTTDDHSVDDLLVDPIRVIIKSITAEVGFTIYGEMDNAPANGKYKVQWAIS